MKNKAFAVLEIKSFDETKRTFKGIATTPTADRQGDIVEPSGAKFKLPIPFIWQHNSNDPIGWITAAKVTAKGIEVDGEVASIPEEGRLRERLAEAWQMLKNKLVRGLSIGFNSLEHSFIDKGGIHFKQWEWLELSAVTIAANQDATITTIKGAFAKSFEPGVSGTQKGIETMKTLKEQLAEIRESRALVVARVKELSAGIEEETATDEDIAEFDGLTEQVSKLDNDIRIKTAQAIDATTAQPVQTPVQAPTVIVKSADKDEDFKGQNYTRMVIAKAVANLDQVSPVAVAQNRWGKSNPQLVQLVKAAVEGGGSGSGEWGAELVAVNDQYTGDFIEYLKEKTIYDQLPLRSVPHNVNIKGQDGAATGYWVGESKAIPVSAADFSDVTLSPLKVAALAVVSNELLRDSSPAAEQLVRDALVTASSQRVDATFISATAASAGVSPAGILNGVTAKNASGDDAAALRADLYALILPFITAKNASGLAYVMNPSLAKSIQLMINALGLKEFPDITQNGGTLEGDPVFTGDNVDSNHLVLLKPSDIYRIGDMGVEVSISREAAIEMDNAPAADSQAPTGATGAVVSMFQTESTAIKVVRPINFAKRRSSAVQYISDAAHGAATT